MSFKKKLNIYILKTNCTPKKLDDVVIIANYYIIYNAYNTCRCITLEYKSMYSG